MPAGAARAETEVSRSRFIASLDYADSPAAARAFLARIRGEFPDASHNVSAFVCGGAPATGATGAGAIRGGAGSARVESCSDDGEPPGTSGRPLLAAIRGSGMGNVAVVVTRYFGGVLLGTGGLARAYAEAGKAVLAVAGRAELAELARMGLVLHYHLLEPVRKAVAEAGALIVSEEFAESVAMEIDLAAAGRETFARRLADLSSGSLVPAFRGTRVARLPVR